MNLNESSFSKLMSFNNFLRQQRQEKKEFMVKTMEEIYDELRFDLDGKDWQPKGRNDITETMINNSTWKFKFSKTYSGQEVGLELQGNIKDDYLPGVYNQLKVTPEVPEIMRTQPFSWHEEGNTRLGLSILLDKIDQYFNR